MRRQAQWIGVVGREGRERGRGGRMMREIEIVKKEGRMRMIYDGGNKRAARETRDYKRVSLINLFPFTNSTLDFMQTLM